MPTYSEFAYNCDVYNQADLYVLDGNSITGDPRLVRIHLVRSPK